VSEDESSDFTKLSYSRNGICAVTCMAVV